MADSSIPICFLTFIKLRILHWEKRGNVILKTIKKNPKSQTKTSHEQETNLLTEVF